LAEDPDAQPAVKVPPPVGVSLPGAARDPAETPPDEAPPPKKPDKGPASHFSGEEPAYVNAEVLRMRREEQRIKAAQEEAEWSARQLRIKLMVAGGGVGVLVLLYLVIRIF
jgi:hypothetical protein